MSNILADLSAVIEARKGTNSKDSYTSKLLADGELNQRKIMEEAFEVCLELGRPTVDAELVANEAADLIYHLMVGIAGVDVDPLAFLKVLEERRS